jgi:hypothetical protein
MIDPRPLGSWPAAVPELLEIVDSDLDRRGRARSLLGAYAGEEAVGTAVVRPVARDELLQALIELLALLLPMGADRIVLALPGRAWSTADPIPPVSAEADLRTPVLLIVLADAHRRRCRTEAEIHPIEYGERGRSWGVPVHAGVDGHSAVGHALTVLLDHREHLAATTDDERLAAQRHRVLLLGHELVLAPSAAARLGPHTG